MKLTDIMVTKVHFEGEGDQQRRRQSSGRAYDTFERGAYQLVETER